MADIKRIGVLTGGGDAPGLNAVIRAVVKSAANSRIEVLGIEDSFDGLLEPGRSRVLGPKDVTGILRIGGTILGTANRGNPLANSVVAGGGTVAYSTRVVENFHLLGLNA
jgi:6-phosphofructokinase 1